MFCYQKNTLQQERLEKLFRKIKVIYGALPPQMVWLGNIEADYLEDFLKSVLRMVHHPHINPDFFGFIRLHVAYKEDYKYCKMFNTKLLLSKGFLQEQLNLAIKNISDIPFEQNYQLLAQFALKSIYQSTHVHCHDFDILYKQGWNQKDVFDAIEHTGTIFRNGRILTAYSKKESL